MDNGERVEGKTGIESGEGCCEPSCCCSGGAPAGGSKTRVAIFLLILLAAAAVAANAMWKARAKAEAAKTAPACCEKSCSDSGCGGGEKNAPQPK